MQLWAVWFFINKRMHTIYFSDAFRAHHQEY